MPTPAPLELKPSQALLDPMMSSASASDRTADMRIEHEAEADHAEDHTAKPASPPKILFEYHRLWDSSDVVSFRAYLSRMVTFSIGALLALGMHELDKYVLCGIIMASTILLLIFDFIRARSIFGAWEMKITEEHIIWNTPRSSSYPVYDIFGKSFQCSISEIEHISAYKHVNADEYLYHDGHGITIKNGGHHRLEKSQSGVNVEKYFAILKDLGLKYHETVVDFAKVSP